LLKKIICLCVVSLLITAGGVSAENNLADIAKEADIFVSGTVSGTAEDITDNDDTTAWMGGGSTEISYRYIRIIKNTKEDGRNLGVRELTVNAKHTVTGETVNLCLGKTASGAYSWTGISPNQAIDGNEQNGWFNQYCGTHDLYLSVDLGADAKNYNITSVDFILFNPHYAADGGDTNVRVEVSNSSDFSNALVLYQNTTKDKISGKQTVNVSEGCVFIDENGTQIKPMESNPPEVLFSFASPKRLETVSLLMQENGDAGFEVIGIPLDETLGKEVIYTASGSPADRIDIPTNGKSYSSIKIVSTSGTLGICDVKLLTDAALVGLINVSLKKTVSGGENSFGVDPNCLVNGNLTDLAAAQSGNTAIDVDLGRRYPIDFVEIVTGNPTNGGLPSHCMIYASNTPDFAEGENTVLLHEFKEGMHGRSIYSFLANGESYRYIRFTDATKNTFIAVAEMSVYSKTDENIGAWKINDTEISVDVENASGERKGYTILAYDADSDGVVQNMEAISRGVLGKETVSLPLASLAGKNVQAVLVEDVRSFHMLRAPYGTPSEDAGAASIYEKEITIPCEGEEFVSVSVIKPNDAGIKSFDGVTVYNVKDVLYSVNAYEVTPGAKSISHRFVLKEGAKTGVYAIRVKCKDSETYYYYNYMDADAEQGYLKDISETDAPKEMLLQFAEDSLIILSEDDIKDIQDFDTLFTSVRKEMYEDTYSSFEEVSKTVEYVIAVDVLQNGDAASVKAFLDQNSHIFGENAYEKQSDEIKEKIAEKICGIRTEDEVSVQDAENLLQTAIALALIENGNVQEKAEAIGAYSDVLGIDLEQAEEYGLSIIDIAKKIKGSTAEEIKESYDAIIEDAKKDAEEEEEDDAPSVRPSRPSGGGGGGGGGGSSANRGGVTYPVKPQEPTTETEPQPEKEPYIPVFTDITEDMWARPYVEALHEKGVIAGDDTGAFRPDAPVSRAEFVKMLTLAFDLKMRGEEKSFSDVSKEDWYYSYVVTAYNSGIVKGKSDTYFGAAENITREDITVMVQRALYMTSKDGNLHFADADDISDYAKGAVFDLTNEKLIQGFEDNTFRPKGFATRAEAAAIISRAMTWNE